MAFFHAPQFLRMPAVGLDISDDAIRFMEFRAHRGGLAVSRYATEHFGEGVPGARANDREKLKVALGAFAAKHKLRFANVSLPEEQAYLANMRLPRVAPKEIRGAIELHLEEHVPISGADALFDFVEIEGERDRKKETIDVVVSVLPRPVVEDYLTLFEGTGISPRSFEFESHATARAVVRRGDNGTFLVVDIGNMQTNVFVVASGVVQFSASLDTGGYFITEALVRALKISHEEAETLKSTKGLIGETTDPALIAMMPVVNDLKTRLLRHYGYWQTHHGEKVGGNIESVLLTGGGANLRGLPEFLSAGMEVAMSVANPWINVTSLEEYVPPLSQATALSYTTAIGLALRNSTSYV
jgi:type IV pilus assembly protein PilM